MSFAASTSSSPKHVWVIFNVLQGCCGFSILSVNYHVFQFRSSSLDCCPSSNFPFLWGGRGALSSTSQMKSIHEDPWNLMVGFRLPFRRRLPRVLCLVCCGLSTSTLPFAWLLRFGVCSCFLLHCFSADLSVGSINSAEGIENLEMEAFRESDMSRARDTVRAREPCMISSAFDLRRLRSGDMGSRRLHVCCSTSHFWTLLTSGKFAFISVLPFFTCCCPLKITGHRVFFSV